MRRELSLMPTPNPFLTPLTLREVSEHVTASRWEVRWKGIVELEALREPKLTLEVLKVLVNDPNSSVRFRVALALKVLEEPQAVELLQQLARDENENVQEAARGILKWGLVLRSTCENTLKESLK